MRLSFVALPFFYGWFIVAVAFVTMGIGVNARTAFSLMFPPILDEFGWARGLTAGAFSFGFLISAFLGPVLGRLMDRRGPRAVMLLGVAMVGAGLGLAPLVTTPWHLYLTLGVLVAGGTVCLGYTGHALFLPNWFVRRRGVAVGAIIILPWLQRLIAGAGWRTACVAMAALVVVTLAPLNLFTRRRPEEMGLLPDGDRATAASAHGGRHPRPDRARSSLRSRWARVGLDAGMRRVRGLLRAAPGHAPASGAHAPLSDGGLAGRARLRPRVGLRRDPGGVVPGQALRDDLWHTQPGVDCRRRHRSLGRRRAARLHRKLRARVLDRDRGQHRLGGRSVARGSAQGTRGCGARPSRCIRTATSRSRAARPRTPAWRRA